MNHPDHDTIERFVMGALDDDAAFIEHVAGCDDCSRKLQREAAIELAMHEVQASVETTPRVAESEAPVAPVVRSLRARRVIGPVLAFAAAAAMIAWVGHQRDVRRTRPEAASAVRVVACPDGPDQLDCIGDAHRTGARLEYPKGTPLAALGSEPGLPVYVEPKFSDGNLTEMDDLLVRAKSAFKTCAEKAIVTQDAPMCDALRIRETSARSAGYPAPRCHRDRR